MATSETILQPHDRAERPGRRRPFSTWVKKLTNFKGSSSGEAGQPSSSKRHHMRMHTKKRPAKNNNPYPQSGKFSSGGARASAGGEPTTHQDDMAHHPDTSNYSFTSALSSSVSSLTDRSARSSLDGRAPPTAGARSMAPTVSTDHETTRSITAPSHGASSLAGTSRTAGGGFDSRRGGDSTFSSPAPSVRSLTTTLTTIQSLAPNGAHLAANNGVNNLVNGGGAQQNTHGHNGGPNHGTSQSIHFNQPFPTTSPASAIPAHLAPASSTPGHPTTYTTATANGLLTDNASILTLASSSKRRRRRSFDTDASVRALAPSSLWGGSRESLPLSVLSANIDSAGGIPTTPGLHQTSSRITTAGGAGPAGAERASVYSATGVVPALPSERNSFYAKQSVGGGDGASVRSGLFSHGRADSINGSITGGQPSLTSPLASPREVAEGPVDHLERKDNNGKGLATEKEED